VIDPQEGESHLVYGLIDHKRADLMLVENFK
jgi:hypothetical protein